MAFLFTLALFTYWGVLGYALLAVSPTRLRFIQSILIAPALGIAIVIIPVFFLSRAGLPVKDFAGYLLSVLLALALLTLAIKRPVFSLRRLWPYVLILLVALLLCAWPMLRYGFDWISYANDDMSNYCLAAQRFLEHWFFAPPNLDDLFNGRDYSALYWFMNVEAGARPGSELMLATLWGATKLNAHQLFMPLIVALHLALVCSASGIMSARGYSKRVGLCTSALLAISPMTTLGVLYQLIGQEGGLVLACASVALTFRRHLPKTILGKVLNTIPAAIACGGLVIWYPEVFPFFGLGWLLYLLLNIRRNPNVWASIIMPAVFVAIAVLLLLNSYAIKAFYYLLIQVTTGLRSADLTAAVFPYFLVPSGLAQIWGILPIVGRTLEPFFTIAIIVGIGLSYWFLIKLLPKELKNLSPAAAMSAVMIGMGILLFCHNNDFGLFKLVMYFQPFFCGVLAVALGKIHWQNLSKLKKMAALALLVSVLLSQLYYSTRSTEAGGLNEVPSGSAKHINRQFKDFFAQARGTPQAGFVADTTNIVIAKFQSLYTLGESLDFPSRAFFIVVADTFLADKSSYPDIIKDYLAKKHLYGETLSVQTDSGPNDFWVRKDLAKELATRALIVTEEQQSIFNRFASDTQNKNIPYFSLVKSPKNHLIFVHSELGNHYYTFNDRKKVAFFQLEDDPMFPGKKISSLGRHLLFFCINPTDNPRVELELTATVVKQFQSKLPPAQVQHMPMEFVGRGSGRVFSAPVKFTTLRGVPYLSIDMERNGMVFPDKKEGLMLLYGRDLHQDIRRITAFGRDISLVTDAQYQALSPPENLQHFPADLANKNLEYSGIYEDGWISERSFFTFTQKQSDTFLAVKGYVPQLRGGDANFTTILEIQVDGKTVAKQSLSLGNFDVKVPVREKPGKHRVDLIFDKYQVLPGSDQRPAGGHVSFIGYTHG